MTAGLGRPLILSTLEPDEAMRVLAGAGRAGPSRRRSASGPALVLLTVGLAWALLDVVL